MTNADRRRLAHILGKLGSDNANERDTAARLADQMRQDCGATWDALINGDVVVKTETVFVDRVLERPVLNVPVILDYLVCASVFLGVPLGFMFLVGLNSGACRLLWWLLWR